MAASALAITQPGDLGGDDTAQQAETTTTTAPTDLTTTTTVEVTTTTTTTTAPPAETTTTIGGSGLGVSEPPSGGSDGAAGTGGESMLGLGMGLLGVGLMLRRALRPRPG